jgi:hypothetical protein
MPILNLPVIPPAPPIPVPTPTERARARRVRARLRSMPSLPLIGRDSPGDDDSDLEDDTNDDDDDDDDDPVPLAEDGDDDERDEAEARARASASNIGPSSPQGLRIHIPTPVISTSLINKGKQREDASRSHPSTDKARGSMYFTPPSTALRTGDSQVDYFTSRPTPPPSSTFRSPPHGPASVFKRVDPSKTPRPRTAVPVPLRIQTSSDMRPVIQKQMSKSMIDLSVVTRSITARDGIFKQEGPLESPALKSNATPADECGKLKGLGPAPPYQTLLRRRSMPTFNAHTLPPPYPSDLPPFRANHYIAPREDEGREQLPAYSNQIYLQAIMPRKMEFSKPGIQAKDRKWRRVMCVLEGTAFKVYKCPPGASGVGVIGGWWEKTVGVGDKTNTTPIERPMSDLRRLRNGPEREMKWEEDARRGQTESSSASSSSRLRQEPQPEQPPVSPARSLLSVANLFKPSRMRGSSQSSATPNVSSPPTPSSRASLSTSRPSLFEPRSPRASSSSNSTPPRHSMSSARPHLGSSPLATRTQTPRARSSSTAGTPKCVETPMLLEPDPADLLRCYTLQNAESGLGNDYVKRKNVIRARMEGEQFLLQAKDVAAVVEWIEGIHAGTNVSLDLDERPMPRGPIFPRRRRRRRPAPERTHTQTTPTARGIM